VAHRSCLIVSPIGKRNTPRRSSWRRNWLSANPPGQRGPEFRSRPVSAAERLKPATDVNLRVRLAAVVPRMRRLGSLPGPFENRQLRIAAVDHDPAHRMVTFFSANLTSINRIDHHSASTPGPYSSICKSSGSSIMQSRGRMLSRAFFSEEDLQGSTVTTNGSACDG
jgi:hypothetical protein